MKPGAWIVIGLAAAVAVLAWRRYRRAWTWRAIAVIATSFVAVGVLFAALGHGGCGERGDCGTVGGVLDVILEVEVVLLVVLVPIAALRPAWRRRRARPPRKRRRRPLRGDAPRMRRRDIGLAACALVFGAMGLAVLGFDRDPDRVSGLPVVLFALVLALPPLSGRLAARSGIRPRLDRVEHDGVLQPALVIPGQAIKLRLMRYGAGLFAACGVALAVTAPAMTEPGQSATAPVVIGCLGALVFGSFAVLGLRAAHRPYRIVLLPPGLSWELGTKRPGYVPWDDITRVRTMSINDSWFLTLDARPGGGLRLPGSRRLARLNRALSFADASIALEAFPVEPARLADVVAGYAGSAAARRDIGTERSLAWFGEAPRPELTGSWSRA
jgi:hypothetical protein